MRLAVGDMRCLLRCVACWLLINWGTTCPAAGLGHEQAGSSPRAPMAAAAGVLCWASITERRTGRIARVCERLRGTCDEVCMLPVCRLAWGLVVRLLFVWPGDLLVCEPLLQCLLDCVVLGPRAVKDIHSLQIQMTVLQLLWFCCCFQQTRLSHTPTWESLFVLSGLAHGVGRCKPLGNARVPMCCVDGSAHSLTQQQGSGAHTSGVAELLPGPKAAKVGAMMNGWGWVSPGNMAWQCLCVCCAVVLFTLHLADGDASGAGMTAVQHTGHTLCV